LNSWSLFYAAAVSQGIFLSVILLAIRKGNRVSNRILAVLVFLLTLYLADILLGRQGFFADHPHFLHITTPLWYLFPPLVYVYVMRQLRSKFEWKWSNLIHLLPFVAMLLQFAPFYLLSAEVKLQYFTGELKPPGGLPLRVFFTLLSPVQMIITFALILRALRSDNETGDLYPAHKAWLKMFVSALLAFGVIQFFLLGKWLIWGLVWFPFTLIPLATFSLIIYGLAYLAIVQPEFIFPFGPAHKKEPLVKDSKDLATRLVAIMEAEKPFLNSELKYSELASRLGISARSLTDILNREIGQSFSDFVNAYRVREVQERLRDDRTGRLTLLAISLESGFNSKTSFTRVFKKHTGLTPSEYMAQMSERALQ